LIETELWRKQHGDQASWYRDNTLMLGMVVKHLMTSENLKRPSGYAISLHQFPMASCPSFHFYNKLPSDVQRLIFEEAFEASDWNAVELAWVSCEVRDW